MKGPPLAINLLLHHRVSSGDTRDVESFDLFGLNYVQNVPEVLPIV